MYKNYKHIGLDVLGVGIMLASVYALGNMEYNSKEFGLFIDYIRSGQAVFAGAFLIDALSEYYK